MVCQLLCSVFQTTPEKLKALYQKLDDSFEEDGWPLQFAPREFFQSKNSSFQKNIYEKSPSIAIDLPSFLEWDDGNKQKPTIVLLGQDSKGNQDHEDISIGTPYGLHHKGSREKLTNTKLYFDMVRVLLDLGYRVYLTDIFKVWVCNPEKRYAGSHLPKEDKTSFLEILEREIAAVNPVKVITWGNNSWNAIRNTNISQTLSFPHPSGAANGAWKKLLGQSPTNENKLRYFKKGVQQSLM